MARQIENVQLVLFSLRKYVNYLISEREGQNRADQVRRTQSSISKGLLGGKNLESLDQNLRDLVGTLTGEASGRGEEHDAGRQTREEWRRKEERAPADASDRRPGGGQREELRTTKTSYKLPEQRLSERSKASKVPATRLGRIVSYGELATGLGLGTFVELSKRQLGLSSESIRNPNKSRNTLLEFKAIQGIQTNSLQILAIKTTDSRGQDDALHILQKHSLGLRVGKTEGLGKLFKKKTTLQKKHIILIDCSITKCNLVEC